MYILIRKTKTLYPFLRILREPWSVGGGGHI